MSGNSLSEANPQSDVAVITGAARRIGRGLALRLAKAGWAVAIHYRNSADEAEHTAREIVDSGGRAAAFQADIADLNALEALIPNISEVLGRPRCLINNASAFLPDAVDNLDADIWCQHMDINLRAPVFLSKSLVANLPDGLEGNIINIIDQRVWKLTPDFFSYTISKAGLWTATRTLAQSLAPRVRVNAIGPGPVLRSVHQTEQDFELEAASTLLGRAPDVDELASAVLFILSASSLTGQMIALDGGQHIS